MNDENDRRSTSTSRFPAPGNGKWIDLLKTILQSQIGGWAIACIAFGVVSHWVIQDRAAVYAELSHLRTQAMPMIADSKNLALENKRAIEEAKTISYDNNRILQEIRSLMNLPLKNQQTLEDINRTLKRAPTE